MGVVVNPLFSVVDGVSRGAYTPMRLPTIIVSVGTAPSGATAVIGSVCTLPCAPSPSARRASDAPFSRVPGEAKRQDHEPGWRAWLRERQTGQRAPTPPGSRYTRTRGGGARQGGL